uniref:Phosphorylase b kinase regulatory subunit n=1 Tax=Laticauda laticaudata TaxID=8630 RepID=A0A8C5RXU4_LATLA
MHHSVQCSASQRFMFTSSLPLNKSPTTWCNDSCLHYFNLETSVLLKWFFPPCRCWLNRRQIDGSLNRTPSGFYDRVWQILERTPNGLIVAGNFLPQQPTLSDMTMYEMNFSLLVEDMLRSIDQPEFRQIIVELLMVVSVILERNPELEFQDKVDLDKLVKESFNQFQKDQNQFKGTEKQDDMTSFYNTPPLGKRGTCSYLTKAVMNLLLEGEVKPTAEDPCSIS